MNSATALQFTVDRHECTLPLAKSVLFYTVKPGLSYRQILIYAEKPVPPFQCMVMKKKKSKDR